jgi:hypothetical protein
VASLANSFTSPYPRQDGDGAVNDNNVVGGGVFLTDGSSGELRHTTLDSNRVTATTPHGAPFGGDPALCSCGDVPLVLDHVTISHNLLDMRIATTAGQGPSAGIVEADGPATITHTRIVDNHTRMNTPHGDAWALSTVLFFYFGGSPTPTISDSVISHNTATVIAPEGEGKIEGVGLTNNGPLQLRRVQQSLPRRLGFFDRGHLDSIEQQWPQARFRLTQAEPAHGDFLEQVVAEEYLIGAVTADDDFHSAFPGHLRQVERECRCRVQHRSLGVPKNVGETMRDSLHIDD